MNIDDYTAHDATGLRELISAGHVTAAEVEQAARQALTEANNRVNGLASPPFSPALGHDPGGPLAGVPFLIKDIGPMAAGVPFFLGSRALGPGVPARGDTDLMRRFRAAGLVTLGLTTMPELGLCFTTEPVRFGPARNPWDLGRSAGGSSGGAAALVAAGAVPVAHASDGAGSIRVPAACCGLVGLKPSRGRVPYGPDLGEAGFGMVEPFVLTRTVRDTALMLDVVSGPATGDKYTAPPYPALPGPRRLRVAVTTEAWSGAPVDHEVAASAERTALLLQRQGHLVERASPAVDWDAVIQALVVTQIAFLGSVFRHSPLDPALLEGVSRSTLEAAGELGALDLMAALDAQNRVTRSVAAFFTDHDVLVTPTMARLPAPLGTIRYDEPGLELEPFVRSMFDHAPFTPPFNVTGQPAISLPLGRSVSGLPIGVQLVAGYGREDLLLTLASGLEQEAPWPRVS
ncbi:amidase [Nonomuraea sp. NPDC050663]|uniref:amidase n=1 Tax=Nonomuraea sp. NPDC050663 TaxID=3364370 RepID=UPI0037921F4E